MGSKKKREADRKASREAAMAAGKEGPPMDGAGRARGTREDGGKDGAQEEAARGEAEPRSWVSFAWWRENAEAFLVAVILAVIIRHFSVEAFEIPTGSMANTLFGMHAWLQCPNCSTEYNVALKSDSSTGKITMGYGSMVVYAGDCPNPNCTCRLHSRGPGGAPLTPGGRIKCGACPAQAPDFVGERSRYVRTEALEADVRCPICHHIERHAVIEKKNLYGGHKILVTKFAYALGNPQRWDVIVFEFDQWKNYIKRLVGLPGERIDVWDGDLYVNGKIERKYQKPRVQESLWTKISDSDIAERGLNPVAAWGELALAESRRVQGVGKNAQWNPTLRRWSVNATDDVCALRYQRGFDNYYSYNLLSYGPAGGTRGDPPNIQVGDKKVAFTVRVLPSPPRAPANGPPRPSWVGAEIRDGDFTFQLRIPVGSASEADPATLTRMATASGAAPSVDGAAHADALKATRVTSIPVGVPTRVEFENVDDRVGARLNGEELFAIEYRSLPEGKLPRDHPASPGGEPQSHHAYLIVSSAQVELDSVQVYRDMYYIPSTRAGTWDGMELGESEYFAMGDNAPSSSDGRYWGAIPAGNLMGKALLVFWPATPTNFQCKFIR